jgi:two-component system chemotaxis response regulator CheY
MRTFIRRVMTLAGFEDAQYLEAGDGRGALAQLSAAHVDLVLTDINMPVMDGERLLEQLREDGRIESLPVLVISTDATHERAHRMMALGARGYVAKPFAPEDLRAELDRMMGEAYAGSR